MEESTATNKNSMHPNDTERPKSCREKFLQAWNEKLKLQPRPLESQSAIGISTQETRGRDSKAPSHLHTRASLQQNENAVYFVKVVPVSPGQMHLTPGNICSTGHCSPQPPMASSHSNLAVTEKELASGPLTRETNTEEEILWICVSDLLMVSPARKRPRLLPPHRKMHVEVWKKEALHPFQEDARNPVPLAYSHLVDTMAMANPADLLEVESFYRRFSPRLKQSSGRESGPVPPGAEGSSLARSMGASTSQQTVRNTAKVRHKQRQQQSLKSSPSLPNLMAAAANLQARHLSQNGHLPPKKRYTRGSF